jgi:sigma-54 dependent transcriptional regulator of gfr operon
VDTLRSLVKENTINEKYKLNNATELGKKLGLSRNWISQYLNEYYNDGTFIKINTRPVVFIDREALEEKFQIRVDKSLLASFEELREMILGHDKADFQKLIGQKGSLRDVVDKCKASISYPPHGLPTLLCGSTGTGKSTIAYLMYEYGVNHKILKEGAKFVHVNCSEFANNPELITANLFGYKKGAFTGADSDNVGMIKAADGGVLFLDEVHCLRPECQEKLFLFMDNGNYHMLGDNENQYHSNVLLVFATTEDPETALLKTLLRRIPIRIEIPSLEERGTREKSQILVEALDLEAKKMRREITISNTAFNALLNAKYNGNVGELFNIVQATCMNSLYHNKKEGMLEIHTLNLPGNIIANYHIDRNSIMFNWHQMLTLSQLRGNVSDKLPQIQLFTTLLDNLQNLQNNRILMQKYIETCTEDVEHYFNTILFDDSNIKSPTDTYIMNSMKTIVEMISEKYGYAFQNNEIYSMSLLVRDCSRSYMEMEEYFDLHKEECESFAGIIEKKFMKEYAIVAEISEVMKMRLDTELQPFIMAIFTLIMHMYHRNRDINRRIGIILAHGYATASSMANAVNQMLDSYIFDAIDMPLDTTTEAIISSLNDFLKKRGAFKDLVLLVDMGSLEDIYKGVSDVSNVNVAIANNVSTKMALMVGEALHKDVPLRKIFSGLRDHNEMHFQIIEGREREKVILCSCATGIGTAEKLKDILEDSLPKNLPVKVLTYDYSTLLENKLDDDFFAHYEVVCIVGTLNPNIGNIRFVPVEELIMSNSFDMLTIHFKDLINETDMEIFRRNILKNFSLSNIIGNLTILNPDKLLEHVADAIDRLQTEMNMVFSYNMCFGLYVHICCLIERLATREGAEDYVKTFADCDKKMQEFIMHIKTSFAKVERYYSVSIPIEEIEYINMYIKNMY